jgi:hypothetical protein
MEGIRGDGLHGCGIPVVGRCRWRQQPDTYGGEDHRELESSSNDARDTHLVQPFIEARDVRLPSFGPTTDESLAVLVILGLFPLELVSF